jgi:hypothetical protein
MSDITLRPANTSDLFRQRNVEDILLHGAACLEGDIGITINYAFYFGICDNLNKV